MNGKITYKFSARIWQNSYPGGWYFVSFPKKLSKEIRENLKGLEEGWGRLKATAKIGNSEWKTSIWYDTKKETYLLPLKAEIRKRENLEFNEEVKTTVWV